MIYFFKRLGVLILEAFLRLGFEAFKAYMRFWEHVHEKLDRFEHWLEERSEK